MQIPIRTTILFGFLAIVFMSSCNPTYFTQLPSPFGQISRDSIITSKFTGRTLDLIEGIWVWDNNSYEVAIVRNKIPGYPQYQYVGVVTETNMVGWNIGETKLVLKRTVSDYIYSVIYFMGDKSEYRTTAIMPNENMIEMFLPTGPNGLNQKLILIRIYPRKSQQTERFPSSSNTVATGTGFFISEDIIATNYHIVADANEIMINWNEKRFPVTLAIKDQVNDLALLRLSIPNAVERNLAIEQIKPLVVGDVRSVKDGDRVFTIGYPLTYELGKRPRVSEGIVNSTVGIDDDPRMFQISVPVQAGNSGGPLFNTKGEVIGVVTSTVNNAYFITRKGTFPQNVNFAVKINYIENLIQLLPGENKLLKSTATLDLSATELMEATKASIVLIEARRR